jgi:predicted Fe-Mo cluster-binding NifX family protein
MELLIAFGTDDEHHLKADDHVGMSRYFMVYKISDSGHEFVERRQNSKYKGREDLAHGDAKKAKATTSTLEGIHVLVGRRFGPNLPRLLAKFLCVVVRTETIADAVRTAQANLNDVAAEDGKGEERKHLVLHP